MSFFATGITSFADVERDPGINTIAFLSAAEGLVKLFDVLGNPAFKVVQNDLTGNITKIQTRHDAAPDSSKTLEDLLAAEQTESGGDKKKRKAAEALLWLNRGLNFTAQALRRNITDSNEELSVSFTKAYDATLSKNHSFVIRPVFSLAMKGCPYRATFYEKLNGSKDAAPSAELKSWLDGLEKVVAQIDSVYAAKSYGKGF